MRSTTTAARRGSAQLAFLSAAIAAVAFSGNAFAQQPKQPAAAAPAKPAAPPKAGDPAKPAPAGDPAAKPGGDAPAERAPVGGDATKPAAAPASGEDVPVNLRLRQLEQRVQALKERAWRAKARVEMLKEAVLGGGIGARAGIVHQQKMGNSYRMIQLVYALDGTTIFTRKDDTGAMHETKQFEVLSGPVTPGSHTLSVLAVYRGHGYGVFKYLRKYKFTVRSSHTFTVDEGRGVSIKVVGFEKGGSTTPLEDRPALDFQVSVTKE
jgi:hypothetical protein